MTFSLREVCQQLIPGLHALLGDKNLITVSVDVQLPDALVGIPDALIVNVQRVCTFLNELLINGIITIELIHRGTRDRCSSIGVEVSARGMRTDEDADVLVQSFLNPSHTDAKPATTLHATLAPDVIHIDFKLDYETPVVSEAQHQPFHNRTILIAEDNAINAMVFSSFVEEWGCRVVIVHDGLAAINWLKDRSADLVLMDIHMPQLDGISAISQIRKFNRDIPILALTASTMEDDLRASLQAGANENLLKPVSSSVLFTLLSRYL
jgi:CheY-like chemotaxis protein